MLFIAVVGLAMAQIEPPPERTFLAGWGVEPRAALWWPNLNGRFRADQAHGSAPMLDGSTLSLDGDLDVDDQDAFGHFELGFTEVLGRGNERVTVDRVILSFWEHRWAGGTSLDSTETFNGAVFAAGEEVDSEYRVWSAGLDVLPVTEISPDRRFASSVTFGLRVIEVELELSAPGRDPGERTRLFYLGGGLRSEWKPTERFFVQAAAGAYFSLGDIQDEVLVDFESWGALAIEGAASAGLQFGVVRIEAGLRLAANAVRIEREDSDSREENEFSHFLGGPFIQGSIRW